MVAVIHTSSSLNNALNYNEQKVKQGKATCIAAVNYPKELEDLTFYQKLYRLTNLAALNTKAKTNSIHISLNFDGSEKIDKETLQKIADSYMDKIGFGAQPYLLYQHEDAGHPHIHIVSTNIKPDGKRIELHNIGRNQSEKARKEIEDDFKLIKAGSKKQLQSERIKPVNALKIQYGKSETKRAITSVLDQVVNNYKYTSLAELNAVLRLYNVEADRGTENSRIWQHQGLMYRVLDGEGNKIGVPIKASLIYNKPTLKVLEKKFSENQLLRQPHKQRLKNAIDWTLLKTKNPSLENIKRILEREQIQIVVRQNKDGIIYGFTYVDHNSKCVFNGSDLGKDYSAKMMLARCGEKTSFEYQQEKAEKKIHNEFQKKYTIDPEVVDRSYIGGNKIIQELINPTITSDYFPVELKFSKRKRKRKRQSDQL
ncbi:MAG TPA: relaxase/mobilization nuclease domain-containing protein [Puia sp.]|nr:relaxase/mobilization nuclease domain-containing protein [Puia sp.]